MEIQLWPLPASSVGEGLSKGTMASASISVWEKAASPALVPKPGSSVLLLMPLELLSKPLLSE